MNRIIIFISFDSQLLKNIMKMKKILFALVLSVFVGSTFTNNVYATTSINSIVTIQDSQDESMMEASSEESAAGLLKN